jgi:hypothetical protein
MPEKNTRLHKNDLRNAIITWTTSSFKYRDCEIKKKSNGVGHYAQMHQTASSIERLQNFYRFQMRDQERSIENGIDFRPILKKLKA